VAPFQVDTGATLLTLLPPLPPALEDERTVHPIWALKAMVVACASVGWKLAQPELHPLASPVERALGGLIWAETERLGQGLAAETTRKRSCARPSAWRAIAAAARPHQSPTRLIRSP